MTTKNTDAFKAILSNVVNPAIVADKLEFLISETGDIYFSATSTVPDTVRRGVAMVGPELVKTMPAKMIKAGLTPVTVTVEAGKYTAVSFAPPAMGKVDQPKATGCMLSKFDK